MTVFNRIDAHQHFWQYQPQDYGWISDDMCELKKDRLPEDLYPLLERHDFSGCIAVQARQTKSENNFLTGLAHKYPWILGVVGWLDLRADDVTEQLRKWNHVSVMKGYRHIVQDEINPSAFLADEKFNFGVKEVLNQDKVYEVLIKVQDLPAAVDFCRRHDDGQLVLDHIGKPNICHESARDWAKRISPLAKLENVSCKLSGIITEAGDNWQEEDLSAYIDVALESFGPERLMFGSDWPVCLLAGKYVQVFDLIADNISKLSKSEQNAIWFENANRIYQL